MSGDTKNNHIVENLKFYLTIDKPEYAFLVSGEWGSGKTHFIEGFMKNYEGGEKKIVKVSLFGLSSTVEINEKIFQELHPVLGSKQMKLAAAIAKGALSMGFRLDLDSDGKQDSTAGIKFDKLDFGNYSPGKNRELVVVLDDFERSSIKIKELLGYVNYLVEISNVHVILVANEAPFLNGEDEEAELYKSFKEKVVGKTFLVSHDEQYIIKFMLSGSRSSNLSRVESVINEIYRLSQCKNLRVVKQAITDFEYFESCLKSEYLDNEEFYAKLARVYFALSVEVKLGRLSEEDLRRDIPFYEGGKDVKGAYEKYFSIDKNYVYRGKLWAEILFRGEFGSVNEATSKLAYFMVADNDRKPAWVRLWNHGLLENDEFSELIVELENDLQGPIDSSPTALLHKFSLAIFFSRNNLSTLSVEAITELVERQGFFRDLPSSWSEEQISFQGGMNGSGYQYLSYDDQSFIEIERRVVDEANRYYSAAIQAREAARQQKFVKDFLASVEQNEKDKIIKILYGDYSTAPFFNRFDHAVFLASLRRANNGTVDLFREIICERYADNKFLNNRPYWHYLTAEADFFRGLIKEIDLIDNEDFTLHKFLLRKLAKGAVSSALKKLVSLSANEEDE